MELNAVSPTRLFIENYRRISGFEALVQLCISAGVWFAILTCGGRLYLAYAPQFFGDGAHQFQFCVRIAAVVLAVIFHFKLVGHSKSKREERAREILRHLETPNSRVRDDENRFFIQPAELPISAAECHALTAAFDENRQPSRIPYVPVFGFAQNLRGFLLNVVYLLFMGGVIYYYQHEGTLPLPQLGGKFSSSAKTVFAGVSSGIRNQSEPVKTVIKPAKGVYYLLHRVKLTTDAGILGINQGTKVTVVHEGDPLKVSDGDHVFEIHPNEVTNQPDLLAQ